jgi:hypothetical protein
MSRPHVGDLARVDVDRMNDPAEDFVKRYHRDKFEEFSRTNATAEYRVASRALK